MNWGTRLPRASRTLGLCVVLVAYPASAHAVPQDTTPPRRDSSAAVTLPPIAVEGRADDLTRLATSASQGRVGRADLRLRPLMREGELLEVVPGMILTQHSGDGKANQMFVRGVDLDHGTDFHTRVEGMPVNLPTHGHGQGYTDVNFLIPELVDVVEYRLGLYYPEIGDFGGAGSADVRLATALPGPHLGLQAGAGGFVRAVGAGSRALGPGSLLLGGEIRAYDGPWIVPQDLRKSSGLVRYTWQSGASTFSVLALTYRNRWHASDQIPSRAVTAGAVDPFGQVDSTLGGRSERHSLSVRWTRTGTASILRIDAYGIAYDLDLFSNFTYTLDQPVSGDQLEQVDNRVVAGFDAEVFRPARLLGRDHSIRIGLQGRYDDIDVALHRSAARERYATIRSDAVGEWAGGAWISAESWWSPRMRTVLGVRGDAYAFSVRSDRVENSGSRDAALVSPKASLIFGPWGGTELYAGGGLGFHSNDARGTTIRVDPATGAPADPVDPLVRSRGAEVGVRTAPSAVVRATMAVWWLELDSELRFVGDAGTTEPSERSRRLGVTWTGFWRPVAPLALDLDVSLVRARYADAPAGAVHIPGAREHVVAAGVTWEPAGHGPFAAVRLRHIGAYPLTEDGARRGAPMTLVNLSAGWTVGDLRAGATILNLLDAQGPDIQYFYASRLPGEPLGGVQDTHFHPVEPRQLRAGITWGF
jgi:hypothetical protein